MDWVVWVVEINKLRPIVCKYVETTFWDGRWVDDLFKHVDLDDISFETVHH